MSHGTVLTHGQMKDLAGTLVQSIPNDLPREVAEQWLRQKGRLQAAVRQVLLDGPELLDQLGVSEAYTRDVDYEDPCWKTIDHSRYVYDGDVMPSDYPETETGKKPVRFREIWFDHDPTDDDVLERMAALNCRQPSRAEVETVIREKYSSEELGRNPRIGLIGSAVGRSGGLSRAYVRGGGDGVRLRWRWIGGRWLRVCRFVVVCKD